ARAPAMSLKRGRTLFESGAAGDGCYWLGEGVLKGSIISQDGAGRVPAILGAGPIAGARALIDGRPRAAPWKAPRGRRVAVVPGGQHVPRVPARPSGHVRPPGRHPGGAPAPGR